MKNTSRIDQALWDRLRGLFQFLTSNQHTAEDLTQELLLKFIRNGTFERLATDGVDSDGHLWSYLSKSARHLVTNQHRAANRRPSSDELLEDEDLSTKRTPVEEIQLRELQAVAERSEEKLATEFASRGRGQMFAAVQPELCADRTDYSHFAAACEMTEGTARVCLHRARNRFRQIVREELELAG